MMNPIRVLYNNLPAQTRSAIRSLFPAQVKRWYAHQKTDVYLISYPKCGRTWLRLMIGKAISSHYALPQNEDLLFLRWKSKPHPDVPKITAIHEDRPMLKAPDELERSKAKYQNKKVIFLARDPRDVIVSSYFEMKKRGRIFGDNPYETRQAVFEGELSEFIHQRAGGFDTILAYYNIWAENRHIPQDFLLVRYEDMKADPNNLLRRVLDFLGLQCIVDETIDQAVAFASFDHMRKMEREGEFQSGMLTPADKSDQDSYKTRKGEVGGFVKYLTESEIESLNQKIRENLPAFYGYTP